MTEMTRRIVETILSIPRGKVSSYRDVALAAGLPRGARQVVRVLHSLSEAYRLPWHRVVKADGHIALDRENGGALQAALLRSEGVEVSEPVSDSGSGQVDLSRYNYFNPGAHEK
ncbi:methylated-DNA--[protein]-cysteine S-methyltransferase [Spirochaetia bacterium]|nr:methylated-DNA--[protein]-cysteine S-methyltransferase [Spirochaetia bacterium]